MLRIRTLDFWPSSADNFGYVLLPPVGNEADHIILSPVRSEKVGFLRNLRRSNVMLSRCKKSTTICTNKGYLEGQAHGTLLGKLAKEWRDAGEKWLTWQDVLAKRF